MAWIAFPSADAPYWAGGGAAYADTVGITRSASRAARETLPAAARQRMREFRFCPIVFDASPRKARLRCEDGRYWAPSHRRPIRLPAGASLPRSAGSLTRAGDAEQKSGKKGRTNTGGE